MIVGLSLILAFLSYLVYRRLFSAEGTSGQSKTLPMWPFLSAFVKQPPNPKPPSSSQAQATTTTAPSVVVTAAAVSITVQNYDAPDFESALKEKDTQRQPQTRQIPTQASPPSSSSSSSSPRTTPSLSPSSPDLHSPETTPKALAPSVAPSAEISAIPQISLLAGHGRGGGIDAGAPGVEGDSHGDGDNRNSGERTGGDETDDDVPPSFPSLDSAQRASGGISSLTTLLPSPPSLLPLTNNDETSSPHVPSTATPTLPMAPPLIPIRGRNPRASARLLSPSIPPQSPATQQQNPSSAARSRLAAVGLGASGVAAGNGLTLPNQRKSATSSSSSRKKVVLEPGHSPLDWARLQRSGVDLRGLPHSDLIKPPADIWTALNGQVYNITAYLPFHPGGEKDLLRGAGKDCTKLFNATHPWVNVEGMLAECLIGIYITEEEATALAAPESSLESVD
ncbi:hypothetical protein B9Z19DRAFT_1104241 [Tuber borchii]|uniref:Cytochrome b5 heme-binding domain-containing protein n=1 Tax=Tuber borchii TaxID=42251 RepID=A0A2T6ZBF7_TUBBO|nr:hypothetical protein B9Z19DRAFT_1104241 [Tuber borchii]